MFAFTLLVEGTFDKVNRTRFGGLGRLGGDLPPEPGSDSDGRAKVMNVPSRVEITVLEPLTYEVVARTVSRADGTWEVVYLNPALEFTVIGLDRNKSVNSAIQDWVMPVPME